VSVLAADTDAEHEPARGEAGHVGELARHEHGMAERQAIDGRVRPQPIGSRQHVRGADEPVEARTDEEADVVTDPDVIEAGVLGKRTIRRRSAAFVLLASRIGR
jgi:hypothetical protein